MSKATRATKMLEQAGIAFTLHSYEYQPHSDRIGLQAAEALQAVIDRAVIGKAVLVS